MNNQTTNSKNRQQIMNIPGNQLISQLNWRYATKQFDPARKISPEDWATLEEALVLSPSSFGLQPWKVVVVTDQAVKERLVEASRRQRQYSFEAFLKSPDSFTNES